MSFTSLKCEICEGDIPDSTADEKSEFYLEFGDFTNLHNETTLRVGKEICEGCFMSFEYWKDSRKQQKQNEKS